MSEAAPWDQSPRKAMSGSSHASAAPVFRLEAAGHVKVPVVFRTREEAADVNPMA